MEKYNTAMKKMFPAFRDVVGIDFGTSATKAVRIKAGNSGVRTVVAADVFPPCPLNGEGGAETPKFQLPNKLTAWTAAATLSSTGALVKLVGEPKGTTYEDKDIPELLGISKDSDLRTGMSRIASEEESSVLIVGVPSAEIARIPPYFTNGKPVLARAELAGLSALECACDIYGDETVNGCDLVIDFGANVTTLGLFVKKRPQVIRQFTEGFSTVFKAVKRDFQTDDQTSLDIILSGQVDIGSTLHSALAGILRQTGIAVDFAERKTGARLSRIFLSGGFSKCKGLRNEINAALSIEPELVNPWKKMTVLRDAVSDNAKETGACFAAATAAAIACLEGK